MSAAVFTNENDDAPRGEISRAGLDKEPLPQSAPPDAVLMQLIAGSLVSQAVYVAAKLGIADRLAEGPRTVNELAEATGAHAPSLYRILRSLASVGVFAERADGSFELTPAAEPLRSDAPVSLRDTAVFMGEEWHWRVWGHTLHSVMTGDPAWGRVHGAEVFPYFAANPGPSAIFNRAMTSMSHAAAEAVVEAYNFSGIEKIVDVAGGHGRLLAGILRSSPATRGVLFDLAHVIKGARAVLEAEGVSDRIEFRSGDFFESLPEGADAYVLKHIIHDWDDERALVILRNIARAMRADGKVLLVEMVIAPGNEPSFGKILDIEMLVSPGGKERTEVEYAALFARAGLRLSRIVPTKSPFSVIEAVRE